MRVQHLVLAVITATFGSVSANVFRIPITRILEPVISVSGCRRLVIVIVSVQNSI